MYGREQYKKLCKEIHEIIWNEKESLWTEDDEIEEYANEILEILELKLGAIDGTDTAMEREQGKD